MRSNLAVTVLAIAVLALVALPAVAQMPPAPHPAAPHAAAPSQASVPHSGNWAGGRQMISGGPTNNDHHDHNGNNGNGRPYHHGNRNGYGRGDGYGYGNGYGAYGAPYEIPADNEYDQLEGHGMLDHPQAEEPPDNRVGPTIFEHNGQASGTVTDRRTPTQMYQPETNLEEPTAASDFDESPNPAVLVFRDGHRQEVSNYAIAGTHVIVLGNKTQKIQLSDLDLNATTKANADRGIDFKMPQS